MTQLLEKAFKKIVVELNDDEQNILAQLMLENDSHILVDEAAWLLRKGDDYNKETQQAMQDVINGQNLTEFNSSKDLFRHLGI